jgi:hypothetical protein
MSEGPEGAAQLAIDWKILEDGRLQITLSSSLQPKRLADEVNPTGIRLLYVSDLCAILRKSAKSIYKLGRRKRNPLPFTRGKGRPFVVERDLYRWICGERSP